ncbi:hypothetical protein PAAG_06432 [Paracoccidioides lutzii Pb01]|uniref:Uncharacterized protein n=1 Tax=Paracoccidioides lutzii (strain ATCC MYA-826 / Pb01) TaxID=502779 RepID=C1H6P1_PARBA|nr:hypothetical protein PAAG_06432 [Paracoccidioides lutzii Pb01]EEH35385.2 hypothetical protein PAAG_06432 [Paracoccidioides lutzii Pb01]
MSLMTFQWISPLMTASDFLSPSARAIYFDADLILTDDLLSAVDAYVGCHIMDNAICGLHSDKYRILATQALHVLGRCDHITLMNDGRIDTIDIFDNLMCDGKVFHPLLAATSQEEDVSKKDDELDDEIEDEKCQKVGKEVPLIVLSLLLASRVNIVISLWLSYWTSNKLDLSQDQYTVIYAGFSGSRLVLFLAFSTILSLSRTSASKAMLHKAMTRVSRVPHVLFYCANGSYCQSIFRGYSNNGQRADRCDANILHNPLVNHFQNNSQHLL